MSVEDLKNKAMQSAMEFMSSERGQKWMNDPRVQKAVGSAFQASVVARSQLDVARKQVAEALNLATEDDLRDMKRNLDRLERRLKRMQAEKEAMEARAAEAEAATAAAKPKSRRKASEPAEKNDA